MHLALLTTGRQDWAGLSIVARRLAASTIPGLRLSIVAGGMHARGGAIPDSLDGLPVAAKIDVLPSSDTSAAVAEAAARTTAEAAIVLERLEADALVVLGDRTETLAAAVAATCLRKAIVHIHGGEETEGAIDNACRHAITKLSHLHFVAHASFGERIVRMGEDPARVVVSGAPALDAATTVPTMTREAIAQRLALDSNREWLICTYHPATLGSGHDEEEIDALVAVLDEAVGGGAQLVITRPNVDEGSRRVEVELKKLVSRHERDVKLVDALGHALYFAFLPHTRAMIGNSSSGIIEAPLFRLPTVNIGDRQKGRLRGANVIDVPALTEPIRAALARARQPETKRSLEGTTSPYGDGHAAERIEATIASLGDALLDVKKRDLTGAQP